MTNQEKCSVIEKIMQSDKISYDDKIYYIQSFLLNYFTVDKISWIWEK